MSKHSFPEMTWSIMDAQSSNDFKSQIDFIIINKKWKNSVKNCRAYNSFNSIASDHRIITADIQLSL